MVENGNEIYGNIGFKLYGFGPDEEELARTFQYNIVHSGKYSLVYDRGPKPAGSALIEGNMLAMLSNEDKMWLADTIHEIAEKIEAAVEYNNRTQKYTEFVNKLREELEAERRKLTEEQNE